MGIRCRAARVTSCARRTVNKGLVATKSASGRSRSNGAKAAPISRPFLALRTWICRPMARAADSTSPNVVLAVVVLVGSILTHVMHDVVERATAVTRGIFDLRADLCERL